MCGRRAERSFFAHLADNCYGERRALDGVGADAQLVKQHECARRQLFNYRNDIDHVRRKSRKRLLYALVVADIDEHAVAHGNGRTLVGGNVQSRLRHEREKPERFERNGLAAGVRTGDYHRVIAAAERNVHRHDLILGYERVTRADKLDGPFGPRRDARLRAVHFFGKPRTGKIKRQFVDIRNIVAEYRRALRGLGGKLGKYTLYLMLFLCLKLAYLVVRVNDRHGFDENRSPRCRRVVNKPLYVVFAFCADRHDISAVAYRDDAVLKIFCV